MTKRIFYSVFFAVLTVALAAFLGQGCVESIPPLSAVMATATPTLPPDLISNFENGSVTVNANLLNGNKGSWQTSTYGGAGATLVSGGITTITSGNTLNNPFLVQNTVTDSTDSSRFAMHVFAPLIAAGGFESDMLVCDLNSDTGSPHYPYYAAPSTFTGIQFLINIQGDDTNTNRVFQVAIDQTLPANLPGGTCAPTTACSCYNHYQVSLPGGSTGGWTVVNHPWADFTVPYCSSSVTPADLANHLNKIVFLQFQFSAGAQGSASSPVSTYTDFWVDDVQFLP